MTELNHVIRIRVSPEDKAAFETEAKAAGLNLSAWARFHLKRVHPLLPSDIHAHLVEGFPSLEMAVTGVDDNATRIVGTLISKPSNEGEKK